jgi:hypothetical protein
MDHRQYADVAYDEPPPPYQYRHGEELPAMPVYELPDQRMLTAELEGHHGFTELASPVEQTDDYSFDLGSNGMSHPCSNDASEHDATADRMVLQSSTSIEASIMLWSLNTQQQFGSASSMTSGGQSNQSSPISPVTPDVHGDYTTQSHSNANVAVGIVSPLESNSSYNSTWAIPHPLNMDCAHASYTSVSASAEASPTVPFREAVEQYQAECLGSQNDEYPRFAVPLASASHEPYVSGNHPPLSSDGSFSMSNAQCYHTTSIPLGTYQYSGSHGWQYCGMYGQDVTNDEDAKLTELRASKPGSSQISRLFNHDQQPSRNYIELHDHQDPELHVASREDETDYPLVPCGQCNKTFSGRYALLLHISLIDRC